VVTQKSTTHIELILFVTYVCDAKRSILNSAYNGTGKTYFFFLSRQVPSMQAKIRMIGITDPLNCKTFALKAGFLEA
jgi:hypothetical protein